MKTILVAALCLVLVACERPKIPKWEPNQAVRREIFSACLKAVPEGPRSTVTNDWAEVIDECESAAYYQSLECVANCPRLPANE